MRRTDLTIVFLGLAFACCGASAGRAEPLHIALVIANSQYANLPGVARCAPAAAAAREALRGKGFEVIERSNLGRGEFDTAIGLLARRAAASPPAVVALYYCGYAVEFNSRSFLLPTSATLTRDHDVLTQGIIVKSVVDSLRRAPDSAGFILLDVFTPPTIPASRLGVLAEQIAVSSFAIIAASNDGPGGDATSAALGLRDEFAASNVSVGSLLNGIRRRLAKDAVAAQFIAATSDVALATEGRRAPSAPAPAPSAPSAPASSQAVIAVPPVPVPVPVPEPSFRTPPAPQQHVMVDEDRMSEHDRRQVQAILAAVGYYSGRIDGTFGPETRAAIRRYQFEIKAELTGRLTAEQATKLVNGAR